MLDTIILQMRINNMDVIKRNRFHPNASMCALQDRIFRKFINNPTKEDKKQYGYLPRLTIITRPNGLFLKVEFSAPKMIFGNNIDELEESDFDLLLNKLTERIKYMGVYIGREIITKANVLSFHPSKNIIINGTYSSSFIIKELSKIDVSRKYDIDMKEYKNGGAVLHLYSNTNAFVIYDKVRDLDKPAKRAVDKDQTSNQQSLFMNLAGRKEILRMEVRIKNRKMKEILKEVDFIKKDIIFEDIFNKDLCKKIVKRYWEYFFDNYIFLFDARNEPQKILEMVIRKYPNTKSLYKIFGMAGFYLCCKDDGGMTNTRNIIEYYKPKNNWGKTKKWLDNLKNNIDENYIYEFIKDIQRSLDSFTPYKMNDKKL